MVVGASGYMGSNIVNYLRQRHKVIAAFNRNVIQFPGVSHFIYMLSERDYLKRMVTLLKPDVIIYCAGITDFMECASKPQLADAINSSGPIAVDSAADTLPHRLIVLSSAYVYDGKKGNFTEQDVVMPQTVFGKSKSAGENYIRGKCLSYSILRFAPVYGIGSIYHRSIVDQIRIKLQRGEKVELAENEMHSFLSMEVALKAIEWIATNETQNKTYNLGGLTKLSWFDFGIAFAESFGFDPKLIVPVKAQFDGDVDFSLNGSELVRQLKVDPLVLEQGFDLLKQQLIR